MEKVSADRVWGKLGLTHTPAADIRQKQLLGGGHAPPLPQLFCCVFCVCASHSCRVSCMWPRCKVECLTECNSAQRRVTCRSPALTVSSNCSGRRVCSA